MDPVTAAILGGTSVAGGLIGLFDDSADQLNASVFARQDRENMLRRMMAERLLQIQLQGGTDAYGNTTRYVPGQGFVTTLDPRVEQLQGASLREEMMRMTRDAALRRQGLEANASRRQEEGQIADAIGGRFRRQFTQPTTESDLFRLLLASGVGEFNRQHGSDLQNVLRQNLRSGGSAESAASILSRFSGDAASRRGDQATAARLQAITGADDITNRRLSGTGNLYNLFATRAANFEDVPFRPEQLSAGATGFTNSARQGALGASQIAGALGATSPGRPAVDPNRPMNDLGIFVSGAGSSLAGLWDVLRERNRPTSGVTEADYLGDTGVFG